MVIILCVIKCSKLKLKFHELHEQITARCRIENSDIVSKLYSRYFCRSMNNIFIRNVLGTEVKYFFSLSPSGG